MLKKYYLKFENVSIGVFIEGDNELKFVTCPDAKTLPAVIGFPFGLYEADKTVTPWIPKKDKPADTTTRMAWFGERVFSKDRPDVSRLLGDLGVQSYDPWEIVKRTKGFTYHDDFWITSDETLDYNKAKKEAAIS